MTDVWEGVPPIPAGAHPADKSGAEWTPHVEPLPDQNRKTGQNPFEIPNSHAMPVWERATTDWSAQPYTLNSKNSTIAVAGRVRGRKSVTLWVPSSAGTGIVFGNDRGAIDQGFGVTLNPGESITIGSEGPVYVGCQSGQTSGQVNVMELFNVSAPVPQ